MNDMTTNGVSTGTANDAGRRAHAAALHERTFGTQAASIAFAPGRVNIIGEHTDYNGGLVLPIAIDLGTTASISARTDATLRIASAQAASAAYESAVTDLRSVPTGSWQSYVVGAVAMAVEAGWTDGALDIVVDTTVPLGAGLSSSAALECSVLSAIYGLVGVLDDNTDLRMRIALMGQRAEHEFAGMPCGIMDQAASMLGRAGHALLLDSGALTTTQVPMHLDDLGQVILLINTNAHHELVDGAYADRRASCERAAAALGVTYLAALSPADLDRLEATGVNDADKHRARHIITEHARVAAAVRAFEDADLASVGRLMDEAHWSMSQDFEASSPELDVAVRAAKAAGATAARMTGGGFGGSVVSVVAADQVPAVEAAVGKAFAKEGFTAPSFLIVSAADGARLLLA